MKRQLFGLVATLGLTLAPSSAAAEDTDPVVVVNGTFSSPKVPSDKFSEAGIDGWTGAGRISAGRAKHPQEFQAAYLTTGGISTRLRGVRSGATVTLSWDDSPDACSTQGSANRTYSVSAAGAANSPGAFTTKPPAGSAMNWFIGRSYSFTAAEDAPQISFTSTVTENTGCGAVVTNVAAKQTAPPPQQGDPCAGGSAGSPVCKDNAADKEKIDKCPASSKECLASVAGDGKAEKDGIDKQTQAVDDFGKVPREQDPNTAATALCTLPNALTSNVKPGDSPIPPSKWWFC